MPRLCVRFLADRALGIPRAGRAYELTQRAARQDQEAPRVLMKNAPLRNIIIKDLDVGKVSIYQVIDNVFPATDPHFESCAWPAVEARLVM